MCMIKLIIYKGIITNNEELEILIEYHTEENPNSKDVEYHKVLVYLWEYSSSPVYVKQVKGTSPCLLNVQQEHIFFSLSHSFDKSNKSSS